MSEKPDDEELTPEDIARMEKRAARRAERLALQATLEKRLGIPEGFIDRLFREKDEWSLTISLAVVVEAALTHALVLHVKNNELFDHFADLSNGRRLQLAKKLGIIGQQEYEALEVLAWMRNRFAHNVKYIGSDLWSFFDVQSPDKKAELLNKMLRFDGKEKIKATDDMKGYKGLFGTMFYSSAINAMRAIATHGNAAEIALDAEKWKGWTLSKLYSGEQLDEWWHAGSSPVGGTDTPLVLKEAAKA